MIKIGDILRHYKGDRYMVYDISTHSETLEELVIYRNMKDNRLWARPIDMFYQEVEYEGEWVLRFTIEKSAPPPTSLKPRTVNEGMDLSWLKSLFKMKKKKI